MGEEPLGLIERFRLLEARMTSAGGQTEDCPRYHNTCMDFFNRAFAYARQDGVEFSQGSARAINVGDVLAAEQTPLAAARGVCQL